MRVLEEGGILFPNRLMQLIMRIAIGCGVLILVAGCGMLPQVAHQPTYHNPFPQLSKVAVAPFFNASTEPTVDGRAFANAYFNELQLIPGFEVVPVGIVEEKVRQYRLSLANPMEVRKLAQLLEVDVVVIGAVTDYSIYYPPRCAMQVEWYAANPGFHPIPVGYGLPWGTTEEECIPGPLVLETEMGLAREQLKTQTPEFSRNALAPIQSSGERPKSGGLMAMLEGRDKPKTGLPATDQNRGGGPANQDRTAREPKQYDIRKISHEETHSVLAQSAGVPAGSAPARSPVVPMGDTSVGDDAALKGPSGLVSAVGADLPVDWPDPRGLVPPPPSAQRPVSQPTYEPVLRHTRTYNGHDVNFTTALESYAYFRDDARVGGWQSYLQRSDDFIRFCCHMHLTEMLTARGGAGETRVVWRWSNRR